MQSKNRLAGLAAIALTLASVTAYASPMALPGGAYVTYDAATDGDGNPTSVLAGQSDAQVVDFNDGSCGSARCSGSYVVRSGADIPYYANPGYTTSRRDNTPYFANPRIGEQGQSATLALDSTASYFGLYWGTAGDTDRLSFYDGDTYLGGFDGSQLRAHDGIFDGYVNFWNLPDFDTVVFGSDYYAFEADNVAYADVPEPGSLAMLGAGLLLIAGLVRRRQRLV